MTASRCLYRNKSDKKCTFNLTFKTISKCTYYALKVVIVTVNI